MKCMIKHCTRNAIAVERLMIYDDNSDFNTLNIDPELVQIDIPECLHHLLIRMEISDCVGFVQLDSSELGDTQKTIPQEVLTK